jgi:hypothetical protein
VNFASDAIKKIDGLPDVNRDFCKKQMRKVENLKGFQVCRWQTADASIID